jgi:hypothetical protein
MTGEKFLTPSVAPSAEPSALWSEPHTTSRCYLKAYQILLFDVVQPRSWRI